MGLYGRYILPAIVDSAMSNQEITMQRVRVVPRARGRVLEVGFGAGHNLPFYIPGKVTHLWALEPAAEMSERAKARLAEARIPVELLKSDALGIPLDDGAADTVVITYTLCSVRTPSAALREIRRVLKPGGKLLFAEHGEAPDADVRRHQRRITSFWRSVCGGCEVGRPIPQLIADAGFEIADMKSGYLEQTWRPMGFNYSGAALKPA